MPNTLIHEKSPYLQQHAHNPVDWLPWSDAAFEKARRENKPVFLSVGYSTCHWCHVMERESFENEQIAALLNQYFVPVKVDREERPDVDRIYMLFVQASTGSGGWPMSVWLTPDAKPFLGGTYFPPDSRYGRAGFPDILKRVAEAWQNRRDELVSASELVTAQLRDYVASDEKSGQLTPELFHSGFSHFRRTFDRQHGGFGTAPKFPRPVALNYLLREYASSKNEEALSMVTETLRAMAAGGMNDQLGGGFHRYSVDARWFVPHFEKMLYDQAQLACSYLEAFQITKDPQLEHVAREIFAYVLRDMRDSGGGFYSAEDADSEDSDHPTHKGEGAFYVWRYSEIERLLGNQRASRFAHRYGLAPDGNVADDPQGEFVGKNILYEAVSVEQTAARFGVDPLELHTELENSKRILFETRSRRPRPHLDDKILTSWNAFMISALAKGAKILGGDEPNQEYLEAARKATQFLLRTMYSPETGRLLRRYRDGEAAVPGFLDDYAFFAQALLDLYETEFDPQYLLLALRFATGGFAQFEDTEHGGFFSTAGTDDALLLRIKDDYDGAEPSGNSVATDVLIRLANLTGDDSLRVRAGKSLQSFAPKLREQPVQAPQMMAAVGRWLSEPAQVVIRCESFDSRVKSVLSPYQHEFRPTTMFAVIRDADVEALRGGVPFLASLGRKGAVTVYECANFVCKLPRVIE